MQLTPADKALAAGLAAAFPLDDFQPEPKLQRFVIQVKRAKVVRTCFEVMAYDRRSAAIANEAVCEPGEYLMTWNEQEAEANFIFPETQLRAADVAANEGKADRRAARDHSLALRTQIEHPLCRGL